MENRNLSLDILRILACIAVVMIHTSGSPIFHGMVQTGTAWYNECLIMDALSRWAVPIFAMITGYFMLDGRKEISIRTLFTKYLLRLTTALVVWSVFYAITLHKPFYPFGSQEGHFWYLGMCIGLYLALPIMRWITQSRNILAYFCWAWLGIMVYQFIGKFVALPVDLHDVIFVKYVGYCLWAYYLKTLNWNKARLVSIYALGLVGLLVTILVGIITQDADSVWYDYAAPNVITTATALFVFFANRDIRLNNTLSKIVVNCSQCTFGIYLIHLWVLIQLFFRVHRFIPQPIPLCIICVGATFVIGWAIIWIVKKIPVINKYIV